MKIFAKKVLSVFLVAVMLFSVMSVGISASATTNFVAGETLYLVPNSNWLNDSPRFAAYFFNENGENIWLSMEEVDPGTDDYTITVPDGNWSNVIFCRMDGQTTENNWDNVWNQTQNLTYNSENTCYYINNDSYTEGNWSTYALTRIYFVNTLGWSEVSARAWTYGNYQQFADNKCTLVDKDLDVYYYNPGAHYYIVFNDSIENGEKTYNLFANSNYGKYYDPTSKAFYETAQEAWDAAKNCTSSTTESSTTATETTTQTITETTEATEDTSANDGFALSRIYFDNSVAKWDQVHIYGWTKGLAGCYAMKNIVGTDVWYIDFSTPIPVDSKVFYFLESAGNEIKRSYEVTVTEPYNCYRLDGTGNCAYTWSVYGDESIAPYSTVSLCGSFNGWSQTKNKMSATNGVYSETLELAAGTYKFKIIDCNLWYGNDTPINDSTSSAVTLSKTSGNTVLNATGGTYTLKYTTATKKLEIHHTPLATEPSEISHNVALSGSFNSWSKTDTVLTKSSGNIYTTTIDLEAGSYAFKIVHNKLWYGSGTSFNDITADLPLTIADDNSRIIATGGTYTFNYNVATHTLEVLAEITADPAESAVVTISGTFNEWSTTANPLTYSAENTVSTTIELSAGKYSFKIVHNKLWYANGLTFTNTLNNSTLTIKDSDCIFNVSGGKYTFTYNVVTKSLSITAEIATYPGETAVVSISGSFNGWSKTANPLTYSYKNEVSTSFYIPAGTYKFKIVDSNYWYGCDTTIINQTVTATSTKVAMSIEAGNCILEASGGVYVFNYDVIEKTLAISCTLREECPAKTATASVVGDFNNWDKTANTMTMCSDLEVSTTINIKPGTYNFKIICNGPWFGNSGAVINDTVDNLMMSNTANDCILVATGGAYTFKYNVFYDKLTITFVEGYVDPAENATVSIAGEFNGWDKTANPLTYSSENVVSTTLYLIPGTYKFKIVDNNMWYGNNGTIVNTTNSSSINGWEMSITDGDCTLETTGGNYTFNYNVVTKHLIVLCDLTAYDPAKFSEVYLAGNFNDWNSTSHKLTYVGDRAVLIDVELEAGTYKFKIIEDGSWYGNNGTIINKTTDTSSIGWTLTQEEGNCTLEATGGKYTFIYRVVPNTIIIFHNFEHNYLD